MTIKNSQPDNYNCAHLVLQYAV